MSDDWLYGGRPRGGRHTGDPSGAEAEPEIAPDATRPVPRQPGPDETRVMPTLPRSSGAATPSTPTAPSGSTRPRPAPVAAARPAAPVPVPPPSSLPPPNAPAPGRSETTGDGFGAGVRRTLSGMHVPRFRWRWLLVLLLAWVVYLVAVPFFAWSKADKIDAFPTGHRPADQPGTTYLVVGSDSRKGLTPKQRRQLHTGNAAGQRTDTIMLIHAGSGPTLTMSIPRDSSVPIPGHGTTKINAAYAYGGPKLLVRTIEQDTGIHIDHYVEIGLGGVVNVVDAVGGIQICPTHTMNDKLANLHVKKGCQHVDGRVALAYARSRHADPRLGDIARGGQQREVMKAVGHQALSPWTFLNPFRYWNLWMSATDSLRVDQGMGVFAMGRFGWAMTHSKLNCVVPISDLYVHWDPTRSKEMFRLIRQDQTSQIPHRLCTKSGLPG